MAAKRKQPGKHKGLTPKQAKFAREYAKTGVGKTAAKRAGYSEKGADQQASALLRIPKVINKVAALVEEADFDAVAVLRELARIASADIGEAFDEHGRLKPIHEIPVHIRRAMSGIEVEEAWGFDGDGGRIPVGDVKKVKFWDKPKALDLLAKHHGLITERLELSGKVTFEELVEQSFRPPGGAGEKGASPSPSRAEPPASPVEDLEDVDEEPIADPPEPDDTPAAEFPFEVEDERK